ncbi:MAG: glycosyl transferase family 2 [Candidatus Firestonebacteria bacterium RIFOXYC2_FULL_39_67]|nr:MAG: glycosyl transferase family 2 [Candidatus Firestonebacteria bacterium RIFOXYD2_FULL_39_29]OGF53151.1 MAG: glycosyl transferase family 2 [Candidatus Firestonebacteria bacterium RifOxyC12_full_39_7]OGF55877.1 MAG: glycosyl transferase family 2 [Candidatus Firestonebacteria bacterium RIFOXYC2_FULL_39_67]
MKPKVVVVMPAYNAAKTVQVTFDDIPRKYVDEIILVDDASHDETAKRARELGLKVFVHPENRGYGGNQKTCYTEALKEGADIVIMLHPDYQYDPKLIPEIIKPIVEGKADLVLASRLLSGTAISGGMPLYKFISNRFLTIFENLFLGQKLSEFHTGYRAYSKKLLTTIPFMNNSENFVFDTEVIVQTVYFGFRITEIPCPTRYMKDASSINFKNSLVYGLQTLLSILKFSLAKIGIIKSRIFIR